MRNLDEINRIKKLYRERHFDVKRQSIHSYLSKSALYIYQKREITLIKLLKDFRLVEEMNDKVVLDIGQLETVDSSGLGTFAFCMRRIGGRKGKLVVCSAGPQVSLAFDLIHIDRMIDLFDTRNEALAALQELK